MGDAQRCRPGWGTSGGRVRSGENLRKSTRVAGMLIPAVLTAGFAAAPALADEAKPKISVNITPGQTVSGIFEVELKVPAGLVKYEGTIAGGTFSGRPRTPLPLKECAQGCTVKLRQDTTWTRPLPAGDGVASQFADGPRTLTVEVTEPHMGPRGEYWLPIDSVEVPVVLANKWPVVKATTPLTDFNGLAYKNGLVVDKELSFKVSAPQALVGVSGSLSGVSPQDAKPVTFTADPSGTSWTAKADTSAYKSGTWLELRFAGKDAKGGHSSEQPAVMVAVDHGTKLVAKPDVQRTADWTGLNLSYTTGVDPVRIDAQLDGKPWHSGTVSEQWIKDHAIDSATGGPAPWGTLRATGDNLDAKPLPVGKHTLVFTVVDKLGVSSSLSVPVDIPVPGGSTATPTPGANAGGATTAPGTQTPAPSNAPSANGSGTSTAGGALARTGSSDVMPLAGAAAAALALGAAALFAVRRRAKKA